jgi:MPBQ/MSBQ methyltransferase
MGSGTARLFDAMADTYDDLEPWYTHLYAVLHALLRDGLAPAAGARAGRALDAGCGTGFQAAHLAALGYETHGIDLSAALLARARQRLPGARLARGSLEALPYATASFDVAACCGSTLSFVEAPARALHELGRVLRPGGRLLLECEHRWSLDLGWALLSGLVGDPLGYGVGPRDLCRRLWQSGGRALWLDYPGYGRLRLFTTRELRGLARAAGLVPVRTWGIHMLTNLIPSTVLHRPRLGRPLGAFYRALCAADDALRRLPGSHRFANSVIVLAERAAEPGPGPAKPAPGTRHGLPIPRTRFAENNEEGRFDTGTRDPFGA